MATEEKAIAISEQVQLNKAATTTTANTYKATPAADAKLLEVIKQYKSDPSKIKPGVIPGTYAVKVHSWFHARGIPETRVREVIAGAVKRNVISKLKIDTQRGGMMLYFDARERPNYARAVRIAPGVKLQPMCTANDEEGVYNIYSHVCHRLSCHTIRKANGRYYARLKSWAAAIELGLRPCVNCRPFFLPTASAPSTLEPLAASGAGDTVASSVDEQIAANDRRIAELEKQIGGQKYAQISELPPADVTTWRRLIAQAIARLDQTGQRPPKEGVAARISRLSRAGVIPREVANMMLTITEMRNAVEYDSKTLSYNENVVAWANWHAIKEWAGGEGLQF